MSVLARLLDVIPDGDDTWTGRGMGPEGKRAFGGQLAAQAFAAACRTVSEDKAQTSLHVQFLRPADAEEPLSYRVERVTDGRTTSSRRVTGWQAERLMVAVTASFALTASGPEHGSRISVSIDPDSLPRTGPAGPAPALPLDELDIRIDDDGTGADFTRRMWWRVTSPLARDPRVHACAAVYVTDVYGIDPALRVHGHSMRERTHRSGTTDSSMWFHHDVQADQWNLLESTSPAASRGRGLVTSSVISADGTIAATMVQEGIVATR